MKINWSELWASSTVRRAFYLAILLPSLTVGARYLSAKIGVDIPVSEINILVSAILGVSIVQGRSKAEGPIDITKP
jgi:phosphate/sulfate permease